MENRKIIIENLRKEGISYDEIGKRLGISRQRVHQILTKYSSKKHTRETKIKMEKLNKIIDFKTIDLSKINITKITGIKSGSRERIRELVRIRDNHTCQNCDKIWKIGDRRFDVHHIDEDKEKSRKVDKITEITNMITLCHKCHLNIPGHREKMSKHSSKITRA